VSTHRKLLRLCALVLLAATGIVWASANVAAQNGNGQALLDEKDVKQVSEHVWVMMGFPNIAFVIGGRATLVVDTGLGERNGATVVRAEQKLSKTPILYLTTTHFHPEHATGEQAFPANTILIRPTIQQAEFDREGAAMIDRFRSQSAQNKELLQDVKLRPPDILFNNEMKLDLGGVTVRLLWYGPAHTEGDESIFVEGDSTLIPGDIVQNKLVPNIIGTNTTAKSWIAVLDKLAPLHPRFIVPDHGTLGDGSLIAQERAYLVDLRNRTLELKRQGKSADEAVPVVAAEFKAKYPDWTGGALAADVHKIYEEPQ
jgi:glyoxylase-like metal-dependent hydrolase (beta-lactamase superfamily II)